MLLRFGFSAFAMPPIGGVVVAAGASTCSASTNATAHAAKRGIGGATSVAVTAANGRRIRRGNGSRTAVAAVSGTGRKLAAAFAAASGAATGGASTKCALNGAGQAASATVPQGIALRTIRFSNAGIVLASSACDAEAAAYLPAVPIASNARAVVWGTFHPVGRGVTAATSSTASGNAQKVQQPTALAFASATVTAGCKKDAVGYGQLAGVAVPVAGLRYVRAGVGYQDAFGDGLGTANGSDAGAAIYPTAWLSVSAIVAGVAQMARGVIGQATATATGGTGAINHRPQSAAEGVAITAAVVGNASATAYATGRSTNLNGVAAIGTAAMVAYLAGGVAVGAGGTQGYAETSTPAAGAAGTLSLASANGRRVVRGEGAALLAVAATEGGVLLNPLSASTFVIEVPVPDVLVEVEAYDNLVLVDAYDNLVEAA